MIPFPLVLKGVGIGLALVFPGMSAGTAALLFGVYEDIIGGIVTLKWRPLVPTFLGVVFGIIGGGRLAGYFLDRWPAPFSSFLMGLVVVSGVVVLRGTNLGATKRRWGRVSLLLSFLAGLLPGLLFSPEPLGTQSGGVDYTSVRIFTAGLLGSSAMVLPGISGGAVLVLLGQYSVVLKALNTGNWQVLAVFAAGGAAGVFGFAHLIGFLLERFRVPGMLFLAGLVLGSVRAILPPVFGAVELAAMVLGIVVASFPMLHRRNG